MPYGPAPQGVVRRMPGLLGRAIGELLKACGLGLVAVALIAAAVGAGVARAADVDLLRDVTRIAVSVDMQHPIDDVSQDGLQRRVAAALAGRRPGVAVEAAAPDRLHLAIAVRPHSSAALRGFYLPFSGDYGIGTVRLSLERSVRLVAERGPTLTATVWEREVQIATRWSAAGAAIDAAVQELLHALTTTVLEGRR